MKKITKKWVEFAKGDLKSAEILFNSKSYRNCIYHCHQTIEKLLKAVIIERGKRFRKTHDLPDLLKKSEVKYTKEILQFIQELNPYYNPIRYPDSALAAPPLNYNRKTAQKLFKLSKDISKWLLFQINQKK